MTKATTKTLTKRTTIKKKTKKKTNVKTREDVAVARATRALKARHLASICGEIDCQRCKHTGRIPRGVILKVLNANKEIYTWLTIDLIKKALKKFQGSVTGSLETISDLTDDEMLHNNVVQNASNVPPPSTIGFENTTQKKAAGRPKGSSVQAAREHQMKREALVNEIALAWEEKAKSSNGGRMKKNELSKLIEQKKEAHQLTNVDVSCSLIRQRVRKNKPICPPHAGTESPMAPVEKYIVSLMEQMAKMRQPLNISEGLSLANSLVEGTEWEKAIVDFKTKRGWKPFDEKGEKKAVLGQKWYKNFWKRHSHLLERKKGHKFSKDRAEWSIYRNFVQMYDEVYEAMEHAGVAQKLPEPMWVDEKQQITEEANAFGRKATHLLIRPDYVVFVDEVGCNTSQEGDGARGGEKKIVSRGTVAKETATTNCNHFTVLGFTAGTGEPIMCAIIVSGKTMRPEVVTGLDLFATKIGEESDLDFAEKNTGEGKMYPNGPTCQFKGKEVPCMVCNTESGSITSELLVSFLKHMDHLNLFPRDDDVFPFLLLDGHGSRLELPFLQYVNTSLEHKWVVCIGVPYGTSYWQVADSSEQNGSYKMALATAKKELVKKKQRACFQNARVETYEIVIIVNNAWQRSFARVDYNKKAIAVRGWFPLTRNLLDHPEIAATAEDESEAAPSMLGDAPTTTDDSSNNQQSFARTLNFCNGYANTVISDILQNIDREAVRGQIRSNQGEGRQAMENITEAKKLTAGLVFKSGRAWLGPEVLQVAMENKRKRDELESAAVQRQEAVQNKRKQAYDKAWSEVSHLPTTMWNVSQLRALVSYKKLKTDKWPQLKTKAQLLEKWEEVRDRATPQNHSQTSASSQSEAEASLALMSLLGTDNEEDEEELQLILEAV
jgi:hypothetical protein